MSIIVAVIAATIAAVTSLFSSDPEPMVKVAPLGPQTIIEEVSKPQVVPKAEAAEITYEPISTTTPKRDEFDIRCSCIKYARSLGVKIPLGTNAEDLAGNTTPEVGALALFKFSNGASHVAKITELGLRGFKVDQGNKTPCEATTEWIEWTNPYIAGFYKGGNDNLALDYP